jgi:hypothetical protein
LVKDMMPLESCVFELGFHIRTMPQTPTIKMLGLTLPNNVTAEVLAAAKGYEALSGLGKGSSVVGLPTPTQHPQLSAPQPQPDPQAQPQPSTVGAAPSYDDINKSTDHLAKMADAFGV